MTKLGTWSISYRLGGHSVTAEALSDTTLEHIANLVSEGYHGGEIIEESGDNNDE